MNAAETTAIVAGQMMRDLWRNTPCGAPHPISGDPCVITSDHTKHKTASCKRWTEHR